MREATSLSREGGNRGAHTISNHGKRRIADVLGIFCSCGLHSKSSIKLKFLGAWEDAQDCSVWNQIQPGILVFEMSMIKFISLFCTLISYTEGWELRTRNGIVRIYDLQVIEPFGKSPKIFFLTRASREVHL